MIASLVEAQVLRWNMTLEEALPEYVSQMRTEYRKVTLTDLLQHRAGFPTFLDLDSIARLPTVRGTSREQRAAFASFILAQPPASRPGIDFAYSNSDYAVAAVIAERATATSWETLVTTRVLDPLMMHAGTGWPSTGVDDQPWGHLVSASNVSAFSPLGDYQLLPTFYPSYGLNMSLSDYVKFAQAHLAGLRGSDGLLKATTFQLLHTSAGAFAMGWGVQDIGGVRTSTHVGNVGTFLMAVALQPSRNLGVAVAANADGVGVSQAVTDAVLSVLAFGRSAGVRTSNTCQ